MWIGVTPSRRLAWSGVVLTLGLYGVMTLLHTQRRDTRAMEDALPVRLYLPKGAEVSDTGLALSSFFDSATPLRELGGERGKDGWGRRRRADVPIFVVHRDRPLELVRSLASLARVTRGVGYHVVVHDMGSSSAAGRKVLACLGGGGEPQGTCVGVVERLCGEVEAGKRALGGVMHPKMECEGSGEELLGLARKGGVEVVYDTGVDGELEAAMASGEVGGFGERVSYVLDRVGNTVEVWMGAAKARAERDKVPVSEVYVVTDPDVVWGKDTPANVLDVFAGLLAGLPPETAVVVGPGLDVHDLPGSYRSLYIRQHELGFWDAIPGSAVIDWVRVYYSHPVLVDTTFGMYRSSFRFSRLNSGVRVHAPYTVSHLGWYAPLDPRGWTKQHRWYIEHALPITEWSKFGGGVDDGVYRGYLEDLGFRVGGEMEARLSLVLSNDDDDQDDDQDDDG